MTADDVRARAIEAGARELRSMIMLRPGLVELAAAVVDAVEPIIRADERQKTLNDPGYERRDRRIKAEVRERLRAQVEALLTLAKVQRDDQPKADMRDAPFDYGQHMWYGGRVVGIAEVLALLDGESDG
jgi:hypothetical protein